MPTFTQQDLAALEVVNQLKSVIINVPNKLGEVSPDKLTVEYDYATGTLSYELAQKSNTKTSS